MRVDIKNIAVGDRIRKEISKIGELAADIAQNDLLNAITVMEIGGGEYQLLAGVRRLKAVQSLGWTDIPVNVVKPADAEQRLRIEISENEQRESFTFSEKMEFAQLLSNVESAKAKERMSAGGRGGLTGIEGMPLGAHLPAGKTRDIVAGQIGMKKTTFDRAKYIINNAPQEVIDGLDKGERTIRRTYEELQTIKKAEKEEQERQDTERQEQELTAAVENQDPPPKQGEPSGEAIVESPVPPVNAAPDKPKKPKPDKTKMSKPRLPKIPYMERLAAQDDERIRKLKEFEALPPDAKIAELERRLDAEKIRANNAEHALEDFKYKTHNDIYHRDCMIENLTNRNKELETALNAANARIEEMLSGSRDNV